MTSRTRYWVMVAVLSTAATGLHYVFHGEKTPQTKALSTFPTQLENWAGFDLPLEPRVVTALGVSDYLSRVYESPDNRLVFLYVGYYKTQRTGISIHSPKNCLPGAGWEPVSASQTVIDLSGSRRAVVNEYIVENGLKRQLVLYWYQSHGRIVASEYRGKIYTVLDSLRLNRTDAALVRISSPVDRKDEQASYRQVFAFARDFLAHSGEIIPD